MQDHVKVLVCLHIVFGALGVLAAIIILGIAVFGGSMVRMLAQDPEALLVAPIVWIAGTVLSAIIMLCAVPGLVAGISLLELRPWARVVAIVISALHLFNIPVGTALGIYGLWVLLNPETEEMFRSAASTPPAISP